MGRKTVETLPRKLDNRYVISISENLKLTGKETLVCENFNAALREAETYLIEKRKHDDNSKIWVCGGQSIYNQAIQHPCCDGVVLDLLDNNATGEYLFPYLGMKWEIQKEFQERQTFNGIEHKIKTVYYANSRNFIK